MQRLQANDFAAAADLLARAVELAPDEPRTQLHLGMALQGAGRHAEAINHLAAAQKALPNDAAPFLHAAISFQALGDTDAALRAASDACHRAPASPQTHYTYGLAWLAGNEPARAEQAFAAAIKLAPRFADAWINYGIARYRQGAIEDAKTAMRQVLSFAAGHPVATSNLAAFLRISGGSEAAEQLLQQQLVRNPGDVGARLNRAADLLQEERATEALVLLDAGGPPSGDGRAVRHWHLQKSLALLQLRRFAEAKALLDALAALGPIPPEIAPLWHWRHVLLALGENDPNRARESAEHMETAINVMGADAVIEHRVMAHYDLAKFWSGRNAHGRAFSHWVAGHRLLAPSQPFSREAHRAFVDANIALFDRARFAAGPRAGNNDPAPVFIVGMPRSGTTLIEQILDAHGDARGAGERSALGQAFFALGGGDDAGAVARIAALDRAALDAAADKYLAVLHALAPDKKRIVDKMPGNFNYLGLVGLLLPGAKIIYCARDPRDIGLSIFTFRFHGAHGYAHDLGDLGWYIGEHERLMAHWQAALPNPILTVKLSDWVEDFDGTLARVLTHIDLPPDPNCARFYESDSRVQTVSRAQVRQPINARGLGRWKAYAAELAPLIKELERAGIALPEDTGTTRHQKGATGHTADDEAKLRIWKPDDRAVALGLAVEFLVKERNFARLQFGSWSRVLMGQINRGHFGLVVDGERHVHGFLGWALTDERLAELWLAGRVTLADADCRAGNCVILNAWAATSTAAHNLLLDEAIRLFTGKLRMYGRRYDTRGEQRPRRFALNGPTTKFATRLRALANSLNRNARGSQGR